MGRMFTREELFQFQEMSAASLPWNVKGCKAFQTGGQMFPIVESQHRMGRDTRPSEIRWQFLVCIGSAIEYRWWRN